MILESINGRVVNSIINSLHRRIDGARPSVRWRVARRCLALGFWSAIGQTTFEGSIISYPDHRSALIRRDEQCSAN
jgi:hypothetical protein